MVCVCIGLSVRNLNEETARIIHDGSPQNSGVAHDRCEERLVSLVYLVCFVRLLEPDRPDRSDEPDQPSRRAVPASFARLA